MWRQSYDNVYKKSFSRSFFIKVKMFSRQENILFLTKLFIKSYIALLWTFFKNIFPLKEKTFHATVFYSCSIFPRNFPTEENAWRKIYQGAGRYLDFFLQKFLLLARICVKTYVQDTYISAQKDERAVRTRLSLAQDFEAFVAHGLVWKFLRWLRKTSLCQRHIFTRIEPALCDLGETK